MKTTETSQAQIEASPDGRGTSNRRHAMLANSILITGESREEFLNALESALEEFAPQTASELSMVEEMIVCKWRQYRLWTIMSAGQNDSIVDQAQTAPELLNRSLASRAWIAAGQIEENRTMSTLDGYEMRSSGHYFRLRKELTAIKARRERQAERDGY